jgi:hypothetical protein
MTVLIRDTVGAAWEKRGNALWAQCGECRTWFPVSVVLTRAEAPDACCPVCHHRFSLRPPEPPRA